MLIRPTLTSGRMAVAGPVPALLAALAFVLGVAPAAVAQAPCTSYPPFVPLPPRDPGSPVHPESIDPLRWTWAHWWESNRWRFLEPQRQGTEQSSADAELATRRAAVLEMLAIGVNAEHRPTRLAAVQAYGRMRESAGVRPLADRLVREPDMHVRMMAATSLASIGTPEAQRLVLAADYPDDATFAGAVIGLGLAERLTPEADAGLRRLTGREGMVGDAAIWALGQHAPDGGDVIGDVIGRSESVWEAAEALVDLGRLTDRASARRLAAVATAPAGTRVRSRDRDRGAARVLSVIDGLEANESGIAAAAVPSVVTGVPVVGAERALRALGLLESHRPDLRPLVNGWRAYDRPLARLGYAAMLRGRIRAAATLAMGQRTDDLTADALVSVARGDERDRLQELPIAMALLGIGERGIPGGMERLHAIVDAADARRNRRADLLDSPLRGFGAIGLGLYARPVETSQGTQNRPGWDRCVELLQQRAADPTEREEVRTAAVVALGITGRTEVLRGFVAIDGSLTADDHALGGHVVMARAMLGDGRAAGDAASMLAAPPHRDAAVDTAGRRAAVIAIGLSGRREHLRTLVNAWHEEWFVGHEVQRALAMLGGVGVIDELLAELKRQSSPDAQAYILETLGRLMAHEDRGVDGFGEGRMFAMRHELFGQYRAMAEPYLYGVLVPALEDEEDERWR